MKEIFDRRSIRKFKDIAIEPEKIDRILRAAMQSPSAANNQPWEFIVVKEKADLEKLGEITPYTKPVLSSAVTLVLLADMSSPIAQMTWREDMGATAENILLEAVYLGLGGVWMGVGNSEEAIENVRNLYNIPEFVTPFSLIALGYPDEQKNEFVDRYNDKKVHFGTW